MNFENEVSSSVSGIFVPRLMVSDFEVNEQANLPFRGVMTNTYWSLTVILTVDTILTWLDTGDTLENFTSHKVIISKGSICRLLLEVVWLRKKNPTLWLHETM